MCVQDLLNRGFKYSEVLPVWKYVTSRGRGVETPLVFLGDSDWGRRLGLLTPPLLPPVSSFPTECCVHTKRMKAEFRGVCLTDAEQIYLGYVHLTG